MSDTEALKIHGYTFSDCDSESSSDEDDENDSPMVSNSNRNAIGPKPKTPSLTDSGQSSGLSDFDDDYYAIQPPAVSIKEFRDRIVKIKAKDSQIKIYACHNTAFCDELDAETEIDENPNFGFYKSNQQKQNSKAPVNNVWNLTTKNYFNYLETQDACSTSSNNSNEEVLFLPKLRENGNTFNYLEDFPPLPQLNRHKTTTSTSTSGEYPCIAKVRKNINGFLSLPQLKKTRRKRNSLFSCPPEGPDDLNYSQEFLSASQASKHRPVKSTSTSSTGTIKKCSCLPEAPKCVSGFNYGQEFPPLSECHENGEVRCRSTSLTGTIKKILTDATVSADDSNYSQEFPSLHFNKNKRIRSSIPAELLLHSKPSSSLDIIDNFFSSLEAAENEKVDNENILSTSNTDDFLKNIKNILTITSSVYDTTKNQRSNNTNTLASACFTEEAITTSTHADKIKIRKNTRSIPAFCTSEQVLSTKDTSNISLTFIAAESLTSEPVMHLTQTSAESNCDTRAENPKVEQPKKKNKLKSNRRILLPVENTKINLYNTAEDFISQKLQLEEMKVRSIKIKKSKSAQTIQEQSKGTIQHQTPKKLNIQAQANHKNQGKATLNKTHEVGPKNIIFGNKNQCCDTMNLLQDNKFISDRKIPDFVRHQLVRNNNATLSRVRLAGERRRRRFYTRLDRVNNDLAKQAILLLAIIYVFYTITSFLNFYIQNIFGTCDNS